MWLIYLLNFVRGLSLMADDPLEYIFDDLLQSNEQSATVVSKANGKVCLRLPDYIAQELSFKAGDELKVTVGDGVLILSKETPASLKT